MKKEVTGTLHFLDLRWKFNRKSIPPYGWFYILSRVYGFVFYFSKVENTASLNKACNFLVI